MNTQSAGNNNVTEIQIYNKNESILDVANHFNISYGTAWARLKKQGRVSRKKKPVYSQTLYRDFFHNIDNEIKAYFAGFLKADGYVDKRRNRMAIRIQEKDVIILKRFCDALNLPIKRINKIERTKNSKHYSHNRQTCVEIAVTNRRFTQPILNIKSKEFLSKIPDDLAYHFIRGYFDGDGSIHYQSVKNNKFKMNIMGNPKDDHMLQYILKLFPDFGLYNDKRSDLPFLQTSKFELMLDFADKVYTNSLVYLPRKKEKFDLVRFRNLIGTSTTTRETTE